MLRDHTAAALNRNPAPFLWPKYQLSPYYSQGDILPVGDDVPIEPEELLQGAPDAVLSATLPRIASAILSHSPAQNPTVPNSPNHVRNQIYLTRWDRQPHTDNSTVSYDAVRSSPAFDEYFAGSTLEGHVSPAQSMDLHRVQVQQLLAGNRNPDVSVPVEDPQGRARVLRDYFPSSETQRPHSAGMAKAAQQIPLQLAVDAQAAEIRSSPQPPSQAHDTQQPEHSSLPTKEPPRRSARGHKPNSRFDDS